jgi:hypothetical protein
MELILYTQNDVRDCEEAIVKKNEKTVLFVFFGI